MKILVTGRHGQVGSELRRALAPLGEVVAFDRHELDLAQPRTLAARVDAIRPDVIVNAAAHTGVDAAESEFELVHRVNAESVGVLAGLARQHDALFVHYSTDYVFDGNGSRPYVETDPVSPVNAYGRTKLEGEQATAASGADWLVFRTSWVYSPRGRNFLRTMLRLAGERDLLRVVNDQHGTPTSARMIADLTAHAIRHAQHERAQRTFASDVFHLTAAGATTWHGFASEIVALARRSGAFEIKAAEVAPVGTDAYPTPARRPRYSVLDNTRFERRFGLVRLAWRDALELVFDELTRV
ncbi:dTDP-4-dehydrorhamnose reductase [Pararobbsia silviterrae]|uniref:dTDP-4-dehydrorhamnose reductase n=1 Tax=Pararobbsia silviterrae TaxID=1792498 RepID=A0A494Y9N3_9BURK|nr:dTDP-4-dehydrorhamnose reductase [Pararobbsia silviterrae]RKP59066.1 dTDP-4-dehydrorhamnose reductase [Pararobbsia silviterrae]